MSDILDPSALLTVLPQYLPTGSQLTRPIEALTALTHTILTLLGFRLVGLDDDTSNRNTYDNNVLPEGWNANSSTTFTLRYTHEQSSLEFIVKLSKLGSRTIINAIATETDKTATLDIATNDFLSPSFYPHGLGDGPPLVNGFISSNRVADFVSQFKLKLVQKLVPGLRKEGYSEEPEDTSSNPISQQSAQSSRDAQRVPPFMPDRPQFPPGFASGIPGRNPLEIGRNDVFPEGLRNPFQPPPLFPGSSGDGMFVGPDHPIFGNRQGTSPRGLGPWGGDGFLPPLGAPPGARFDPVFPGPLGPGGNGRRSGPRGPLRNGDPDNDELMPPGAGDMFM